MPMLANMYGIVFIIGGLVAGGISLLFAITLETAILARLWGRSRASTARLVLAANAVSATLGVVPVVCMGLGVGPGMEADAWQVHQWFWLKHVAHVLVLLTITTLVEWRYFRRYFHSQPEQTPPPTIWRSTLAANCASYACLLAFMLSFMWLPDDYAFLPDTNWLRPTATRVWFVDPDNRHLCSVQLDGHDRRTEVAEPIHTLANAYWSRVHPYAVVPAWNRLFFVDADHRWVEHSGSVRREQDWPLIEGAGPVCAQGPRFTPYTPPAELLQAAEDPGGLHGTAVYLGGTFFIPWGLVNRSPRFKISSGGYGLEGSGTELEIHDERTNSDSRFAIRLGLSSLSCINHAILDDEGLIVARVGGSIIVLDPAARKAGVLVRGESMMLLTEAFRYRIPPPASRPGSSKRPAAQLPSS